MSKDSDIAQVFNAWREARRELRDKLGVKCPACVQREPKRDATILVPSQRCYCGYQDPRPRSEHPWTRRVEG